MTRIVRALCRLSTLALVLAALPVPARAGDLTGNDLLVPIVSRTPGAAGSEWRTDLTVTNVSHSSTLDTTVFITFTQAGTGAQAFLTRTMVPRQTLVFDDVLLNSFGLANAIGSIRVTSPKPSARLIAHARIYNRANPVGEFGQGVPGLPVDGLTREHYLTGLSGLGANRSNVGISNPWDVPVLFSLTLIDRDGEFHGAFTTAVGPRQVVQYNDIFPQFVSEPLEGATVRVTSEFGVYAYASVVRSDSGDGRFVTGSGFARGNEMLAPTACSYAAPVVLAGPGAQIGPGWIVQFVDAETDPAGRAAHLAQQHGFTVTHVLAASKAFHAELNASQLAAVRCDTAVAHVYQNVVVPIP